MLLLAAHIAVAGAVAQAPAMTAPDCQILAGRPTPALSSLCQGEENLRAADAAPAESAERERRLTSAADSFRRAAAQLREQNLKMYALDALTRVYDARHLNEPRAIEEALREMVALAPDDSRPLLRLATLQDDEGNLDAAENTLLSARQRRPDDADVYEALSRFYAARAAAARKSQAPPAVVSPPDAAPKPDAEGYFRIGDSIAPPEILEDVAAEYPLTALNDGVEGVVAVEIKIDERGLVTDATVVKSVPVLDQAALKAARQWRFVPTMVDGRPVKMRMLATVRFDRP